MRLANAVRAAMNDAQVDRIDLGTTNAGGRLQIRSGAAPAAITDAAAGTLLAEFALPNPAFGASSNGVATANAVATVQGLAAGTAGHYRVLDRDGAAVWDSNSVGTSGTALVLNTTTISVGVDVSLASWTVTQPAGSV